ncbi:ATP-binding protein [Herbihabitans rhizosphaerae]|uniref:ATP-binding protein n=1 Tax=Herbihabitans rhizosphaerae TaxID=1872711 RepID=UPI001F5FC0BD|nr:LuxR C-terminal-related transcriptional regulator [Herbihabitans rhizosphaerae]
MTAGAAADRSPANTLPAELTTYVGRRAEILEVRRLLGAASVITLTGPGGVGKTRLALRVAAASRSTFPDGVVFVALADLHEPALLMNTVASRLGLENRSVMSAIDVIVDHVRNRRMLLVLDNCEHMVEPCARFVEALVTACPGLVVLTTSRQSLGVAGERVLPLPPLSVPDTGAAPTGLDQYDAVRLFVDRATAIVPAFTITEDNVTDVVTLCRRLEGHPLAIELAAARLRALSVRQVTERLDEQLTVLTGGSRSGPGRHETLRAMVDWSYDLCTEPERLLWGRASVFSGSFDLDAAEQVCSGDGLDRDAVLDVLDGLLDKSILLREEDDGLARYRMLETMRQYGEDRLRSSGDLLRMRRRHRDWCFAMTSRFESEWIGPDQVAWIDRLRREHPNLRVALDFCAGDPAEAAVALRTVLSFKEYWIIRGLTEGRMWLSRLVAAAPDDAPGRGHAQWIAAFLALVQGDIPAFEASLGDAAGVAERTDDDRIRAYVYHVRAYQALIGDQMSEAMELFGIAKDMFRQLGDQGGELWSTYNYGLALSLGGELAAGRRVLWDCVDTLVSNGEVFWRSWTLWSVGAAEYLRGDIDEARKACKEVLLLQRRVHDRVIVAFAMTVIAGCAAHSDRPREAAQLLGGAATVWRSLGASPNNYAAFVEPIRKDTELVAGQLGFDEAAREFMVGAAWPTEDAVAYALGEKRAGNGATVGRTDSPLTKRETEIAGLVAEGLTNRQIAVKLSIAPRTAETHVEHILTKLGFTNRAQIAAWVVESRRS